MSESTPELPIRRLLDVGRGLLTELDQRAVLDRVLQTARELTGARYAALGILNEQRTELAQFITAGVDEQTHAAIGDLPRGRGVLGALIEDPRPLRLADVGQHPNSYGFPSGHPVMRNFLGVPIVIRGRTWGNLYLTEKSPGEFTEGDEEAATLLADWAAIAIDNARLYETSERRRGELEKALRGLEATRDVAVAIGGEIGLDHALELIVKRGRALVDARSLVIMLREGPELVAVANAGHLQDIHGLRVTIAGSTAGDVLLYRRAQRIANVHTDLRVTPDPVAALESHTALLVPLVYRGEGLGVLAAYDRGAEGQAFSEDDEQLLRTFAASAATAVAMAQSVQADRLRSSLAAADAERRRWARELHDETLQGLGGLRLLLASALRSEDAESGRRTIEEAVEHIEREIENLRSIITELRPAALDELGLATAIEALLDRHRDQGDFSVLSEIDLPDSSSDAGGGGGERLHPEIETAVYRLLQEALTNVAKHAQAEHVRVLLAASNGEIRIEIHDDGVGIREESARAGTGFGLAGMRERVSIAGGTLAIESHPDAGTTVRARLPLRPGARVSLAPSPRSGAQQAVS